MVRVGVVWALAGSWRYFNLIEGRVPPNDLPHAEVYLLTRVDIETLIRGCRRSVTGVRCGVATKGIKLAAPKGLGFGGNNAQEESPGFAHTIRA